MVSMLNYVSINDSYIYSSIFNWKLISIYIYILVKKILNYLNFEFMIFYKLMLNNVIKTGKYKNLCILFVTIFNLSQNFIQK